MTKKQNFLGAILTLFNLGCASLLPQIQRSTTFTVGQPVNIKPGTVQGLPSKLRQDVSAYLGIPFGQAPVGALRFSPPVAVTAFNSTINATDFGPDCPSNHIPTNRAFLAGPAGQAILVAEAQTGRPLSEDCLSLNVWTKPQTGESSKAVLFWLFGGGFSIGNTACQIYDGSVLADENDVVVVSPNYRVNIFGFSGGPGLTQNVGLLDQRLALEWVRDNIAAFGGDPNRIVVFGQSAGGASTDFLDIMYPNDPIAHGFIPQSGVASGGLNGLTTPLETVQGNWFKVSQKAGCGGSEAGTATVACLRTKSTQEILTAMSNISLTAIASGFQPVPDGISVPNDATAKVAAGNFSKLPMMTGNTDDEAAFFPLVMLAYTNLTAAEVSALPYPLLHPLLDLATLVGFTCGASKASRLRQQQGITTYRYRFFGGNYTNIYVNFLGAAYHTSELPLVFGTASAVTGIQDTTIEARMGSWMRQAWAAFAKDPQNGPTTELGWPKYDPLENTLARLAFQNETVPSFISAGETDLLCPIIDVFIGATGSAQRLLSTIGVVMSRVANGNGSDVIQLLQENPTPWNPISLINILHGLLK